MTADPAAFARAQAAAAATHARRHPAQPMLGLTDGAGSGRLDESTALAARWHQVADLVDAIRQHATAQPRQVRIFPYAAPLGAFVHAQLVRAMAGTDDGLFVALSELDRFLLPHAVWAAPMKAKAERKAA